MQSVPRNGLLRVIAWSAVLTLMALFAGCIGTAQFAERDIALQTSDSDVAVLTEVRAWQNGSTLMVAGDVEPRYSTRGWVPGHVEVRIVGPGGRLLRTVKTDYERAPNSQASARFLAHIPADRIPPGSTLEVLHRPPG